MADKSIDQLNAAEKIYATDLFVLQQSGSAKKLTGQVLLNWLTAAADGHGGIQSIAKLSTSGLVDTYRITLADTTTFDFVVNNGRDITGISKTGTSGLVDTYTISYNDGTTSKFTVTNGAKGDKGDNAYIWIKYASQKPTESSHSMGDTPDDWIGIYSGNASTAPTDWKQYKWFRHKGERGDTGAPATLVSTEIVYQSSDSGTIIPSGAWSTSIPVVAQGKYLWKRTTRKFNSGEPEVSYDVNRMGIDGSGSVSSVAGVSPDSTGNVTLTAADVGALAVSGGDMTGEIRMNGQLISGLNDPTEDTQAARKGYVDTSVRKAAQRNLLDNSDFRNPVNQRGQTSYTSAYGGYTIDRWIANAAITLNVNTGSVTALSSGNTQNEIYQTIANPDRLLGKTVTFAIKTDIGTFVANATIPNNFTDSWVILGTTLVTDFGQIHIQVSDNSTHMILTAIAVKSGGGLTIHWAALYEGTYTAETLPEYQPKGYGAELAECQRYFLKLGDTQRYCSLGIGVARDTQSVSFTVPTPVTMRTIPGLVSTPVRFMMRHSDSNMSGGTNFTVDAASQNSVMINVKSPAALTAGEAWEAFLEPGGSIMLSADL